MHCPPGWGCQPKGLSHYRTSGPSQNSQNRAETGVNLRQTGCGAKLRPFSLGYPLFHTNQNLGNFPNF